MAFLKGIGLGLSLAAPPGPMNALLANETLRGSFFSGFGVGLGALTTEFIYATAVWFGAPVLVEVAVVRFSLASLGALLMGWFALGAFRTARALQRKPATAVLVEEPPTLRRHATSYGKALALGVTNPYQIAWWATAGASYVTEFGWRLLGGLIVGVLVWITAFPLMLKWGQRRAHWFEVVVGYVSAAGLAAFAILLGWLAAQVAPEVA